MTSMKQNIIVFFVAFVSLLAVAFALQEQAAISGPTSKILFVGNSYTFVHDVPGTLKKIARSKGKRIDVDMAVKPGATFAEHAVDSDILNKIASEPWDYIVLQEQSQRMAWGSDQWQRDSLAPAMSLVQYIRQKVPNAKILLYSTWGRKNGDKDNCATLADVCTYEGMQRRITSAYGQLAARANALVVPVGKVWQYMRQKNPTIELYEPDETHQSVAGAYLSAATFYKPLFHDSVLGAKSIGIDQDEALAIQTAVDLMAQ